MKENAGLGVIFMVVNFLDFFNTTNSAVCVFYFKIIMDKLADRFKWERMKSVEQIVIKYYMFEKKTTLLKIVLDYSDPLKTKGR